MTLELINNTAVFHNLSDVHQMCAHPYTSAHLLTIKVSHLEQETAGLFCIGHTEVKLLPFFLFDWLR